MHSVLSNFYTGLVFRQKFLKHLNVYNVIMSYQWAGSQSGRPHTAQWCCYKEVLPGLKQRRPHQLYPHLSPSHTRPHGPVHNQGDSLKNKEKGNKNMPAHQNASHLTKETRGNCPNEISK